MKKLLVLLLGLCLVGCGQIIEKPGPEVAVEHETFLEEDYVDYSGVKNIIKYLKREPEDVTILHQTDRKLVFCFSYEETNLLHNYVKEVEKEKKIKSKVYDTTLSSTIELIYDNYIIQITTISDLEKWKETHKDEFDVDLIEDENIVYEVKLAAID